MSTFLFCRVYESKLQPARRFVQACSDQSHLVFFKGLRVNLVEKRQILIQRMFKELHIVLLCCSLCFICCLFISGERTVPSLPGLGSVTGRHSVGLTWKPWRTPRRSFGPDFSGLLNQSWNQSFDLFLLKWVKERATRSGWMTAYTHELSAYEEGHSSLSSGGGGYRGDSEALYEDSSGDWFWNKPVSAPRMLGSHRLLWTGSYTFINIFSFLLSSVMTFRTHLM